jgi:integrase
MKVNLLVAHQQSCAHRKPVGDKHPSGPSSLDFAKRGCTCQPSYFTFYRDLNGRAVKGERVRDRSVAERLQRKLQVELDESATGLTPAKPKDISVSEWCDKYEEIKIKAGWKGSTIRAYWPTFGYAKETMGGSSIRAIGNEDLRRFNDAIRANKGVDATVSKHLRHLSAMFAAAVAEGYAAVNPVPRFKKSLNLKVPKGDESYTDIELARLWSKMEALEYEPVYIAIAKAAVLTGARIGELVALDWDALDLSTGLLQIRKHYDPIDGLVPPKDGDERTVNLVPQAVALFEDWTARVGVQPGPSPIFPAPRSGGRINSEYLRKLITKATEGAGIPGVGEGGRRRRPVHAFRASYTRILLKSGENPAFVQGQLGHSSIDMTVGTYGKWSAEDTAKAAQGVKASIFPV